MLTLAQTKHEQKRCALLATALATAQQSGSSAATRSEGRSIDASAQRAQRKIGF